MTPQARLGISFDYDENWIGGSYYVLNLLSALKQLAPARQPLLVLFGSKDALEIAQKTNYPQLKHFEFRRGSMVHRALRLIGRKLGGAVFDDRPPSTAADLIFPAQDLRLFSRIPHCIRWIPDWQDRHMPHLFSEKELAARKAWQAKLAAGSDVIVFSSEDSLKDFRRIFPESKAPVAILKFAVTHPEFESLSQGELLQKYNLPADYYFCPNQLWAHKNHTLVIEAVARIVKSAPDIFVAFSGKEYDSRNPSFAPALKAKVTELGLEKNIRFLGFIDRREQLKLMSQARAIVQPSLFEGWSTVVEDAKAMNQFVILSDIPVHREQMTNNCAFFDPKNADALAELLVQYQSSKPPITRLNYEQNVTSFAETFLSIVDRTLKKEFVS